jgi:hypothetical protein
MRALGEAVPSLPATSSKGLSRSTGVGSGTLDRDRERDRDRPRKRAKTRSGIGTGNGNGNGGPVKAGTSKEANVVDAKEMVSHIGGFESGIQTDACSCDFAADLGILRRVVSSGGRHR